MTTILIVEDNEMNMKLARDVLNAKSFDVLEAKSGEDGVALAVANNPDLILMDIQLPGIDGIEAFHRMRSDNRTAQIPVVAFTAAVTSSDWSRVKESGFDAFVSKPLELKSFIATIENTLAQKNSG